MIGTALDYTGLSTLVVAIGTAAAAIIAAVYAGKTHRQVSTNGDPRTLGQIASDVAAEVAPAKPPDHAG
jgi:hypothetical protein